MTLLEHVTALYEKRAEGVTRQHVPRLHPNGFIQLDLVKDLRLHVWPDDTDLKRQQTVNDIHDHVFDMQSTVILGWLIQTEYDIRDYAKGTFEVYRADYDTKASFNARLVSTGRRVEAVAMRQYDLYTGSTYVMNAFEFHRSKAIGLTATLMRRTRMYYPGSPRVLCEWGVPPDNDFDRNNHDAATMWNYIFRVLLVPALKGYELHG